MGFIQYSREAFGAPWEHPVGEATVRRSFEPHTDHRPKIHYGCDGGGRKRRILQVHSGEI